MSAIWLGIDRTRDLPINDPNHTSLAVPALRVIKPEKLRVVNLDKVSRYLYAGRHRHESRREIVTLDWIFSIGWQGWSNVD